MSSKKNETDIIKLAHGGGGTLSRDLIRDLILKEFDNSILARLDDAAPLPLRGEKVVFTTDSYVVDPIFFPGGDIGKLAITGTVNDIAVMGAVPKFISCGIIVEEGLPITTLQTIIHSLGQTAKSSGVKIVAGDFKVVEKGSADKIFINTSGIGVLTPRMHVCRQTIRPGDAVIVSGPLGDHGVAIMLARESFSFTTDIQSDCQPLNEMIKTLAETFSGIKFMRDPTRGGLAAVLNEITEDKEFGIELNEEAIPVRPSVRNMCDILGLDPLHLANEGKVVIVTYPHQAEGIIKTMHRFNFGKEASIIGTVSAKNPSKVYLKTATGGNRLLDRPQGDLLPRIC